jgi:soluble lytic murein transglycosylase-like protein
MQAIASDLKLSADTATASLAELAAKKVAEERRKTGGLSSGKTMMIMVDTLKKVQQSTKSKTKKHWVKIVAAVGAAAAVVVVAMGIVIFIQKRQLDALVADKLKIDGEIARIEKQMETEEDPEKLDEYEQKLAVLTGKAENAIAAIGKKNKQKAAEVEEAGDDLDKEIRRILKSFDATTYTVPPVFKERLKFHVDALATDAYRKRVYRRKQTYWPMIQREFKALGLPEEMAYVAWVESQFDPEAKSPAGAAGLWQFTKDTGKAFKLRVEKGNDERHDPDKATKAAAKYLAGLLAEFGTDSFMLAMAAYNKGEAGVRRVLRQIAQEKDGFRKDKRDFWHLYRMKKLPEETREYVPKILAAAIVGNAPEKYGLE